MQRSLIGTVAWMAMAFAVAQATCADREHWQEVAPGVLRSAGLPGAYALVDGEAALLIGAARGVNLEALKKHGVKRVERALLTHHHSDSSARAGEFVAAGIKVSAPGASAEWIEPEKVQKFWEAALPVPSPSGREPPLKERTFNDWVYRVLPAGIAGVNCSLNDGDAIEWRSWRIACIATPGHSRDHMAYAARRDGETGKPIVFCGDALSAAGKMPTPYTTDWDHWTGRGLQAAVGSLRRLAALDPALLCPEGGPPIRERPVVALFETAMNAAEVAFLKSYERYTKERLASPPSVSFLARQQVTTAGDEPWTELTPHLYLTGNTFALASREGPVMLLDAYGPRIVEQLHKLQADRRLGPLEVVTISHAHNDHYKGIYLLPKRDSFQVWTQARVAEALTQPYRYCAPYLDARALVLDKAIADGERVCWHEYEFRVHHLPGQTDFGMGLEVTIDGHKCFFTGDSFYHADQFSGSGGWSGRNRGLPLPYAVSAKKILEAAPDWILCEHGGAFTFDAEDFRRRIAWAHEAARATDALSPTSDHRRDWAPQRFRVEPLLQRATPGQTLRISLASDDKARREETLQISWDGNRALAPSKEIISWNSDLPLKHDFSLTVAADAPPGRHVFPLTILHGEEEDGADSFFVVDVVRSKSR